MACRCAPALLVLARQFDATWPKRDRSSDGCCGDAAHAARKSDHNPDAAGYAHAHDFDEDIAPGLGNAPLLFVVPLLLADDRAKYVIYERRIYYARCSVHGASCFAAGGHAYSGTNAHEHHLHLSIRADATHDIRPWHLVAPPNTTSPEDDVTPADIDAIANKVVEKLAPALATGNDGNNQPRGPLGGVVARLDERVGKQGRDLGWLKDSVQKIAEKVGASLRPQP